MLCVLVLLPSLVLGDCKEALKYKVGAIAAILLASAVGVCIPLLGRVVPPLRPEKDVFFPVKAFAARVILATGLIHVLPDSFDSLTSPCLDQNPWGNFPFTGFVAMVAAIGSLMVDTYAQPAASEGDKESDTAAISDNHARHLHVRTHATHGHAHGSAYQDQEPGTSELLRHRVVSQLGILVHSVMIGISLGTSGSTKTVKPLMAAFTFHQFFEGMGLGGCITQAKFKARATIIMALFFSLTMPAGIAIGIGISDTAYAASAGILVYMALVDLLAVDFMSAKVQGNGGAPAAVQLLPPVW
ncbi:hypothetical protein EUGRSUZ_A00921 [Eucalyptus grandis]|uniref:Uncharacterized protein n=2 Tax=Eucalyptus grandis TaxID=71139 RepID=A0ACC3M0F6_EUCGR|nr:hypothetical protein EUGRSUZ_A00921 [Eucalyptus grandis]